MNKKVLCIIGFLCSNTVFASSVFTHDEQRNIAEMSMGCSAVGKIAQIINKSEYVEPMEWFSSKNIKMYTPNLSSVDWAIAFNNAGTTYSDSIENRAILDTKFKACLEFKATLLQFND